MKYIICILFFISHSLSAQIEVVKKGKSTGTTYSISNSADAVSLQQSGGTMRVHPNFYYFIESGGTLGALVTSIGSTDAKIIVERSTSVTSSARDTIPSNIQLEVKKGGLISPTRLFVINGPIEAGDYQIFGGANAADSIEIASDIAVNPRWWASKTAESSLTLEGPTKAVFDTTTLKLMYGAVGTEIILRQLSSAFEWGGGKWVLMDSTHKEGYEALDSQYTGLQWVRAEVAYNKGRMLNMLWGGVRPDSTNMTNNSTRFRALMKHASAVKRDIYAPIGKYLVQSANFYPGVALIGESSDYTQFYVDTTGSGMGIDNIANAAANWKDRVYTIKNISIIGNYPYDVSDGTRQTGGGAGIHLQATSADPAYRAVFENINANSIKKEAIKSAFFYESFFRNCSVKNSNMVAYTSTSFKIEISNCTVDTAWAGAEMASVSDYTFPETYDSLSSFSMTDCNFNNVQLYAIALYGGEHVRVSDFTFTGPDTGTFTLSSSLPLIFMKPKSTYDNMGDVIISDGILRNSGGYGIRVGPYLSSNAADQTLGNVLIDNIQIKNSYYNGIIVESDTTGVDSLNVGNVKIINCVISNSNRAGVVGTTGAGIYLNYIYHAEIADNIIYDTGGSDIPIGLTHNSGYWIHDNVLDSFGSTSRIWTDSSSVKNLIVENNKGLYPRAIIETDNTRYYYQHLAVDWNGARWMGGYPDQLGWKFVVLNSDSLCIEAYNSAGTKTSTTKIAE